MKSNCKLNVQSKEISFFLEKVLKQLPKVLLMETVKLYVLFSNYLYSNTTLSLQPSVL